MKWIEAKVIFDSDDMEIAMELVSEAFYKLGLKGIALTEPLWDQADNWAKDACELPDYHAITGWLPDDERLEQNRRSLEDTLSDLQRENGIAWKIVYSKVDEQDWSESWKTYFRPQKISKRIVIKPTWRKYAPDPDEIVIELDPGMAFGIGSHPTTRMSIRLIEKFLYKNDTVLDVGTGSGILMIVAAKLGAGEIVGVDVDPHAVEIARNNLLLNRIDENKFKVLTSNLVDSIKGRFDMVVANITFDAISELLNNVKTVLTKEKGLFIVSGIVETDKDILAEKMNAAGFELVDLRRKEEWIALASRLTD
jgi:ribosomal protein L11 methyltransferase